MIRDLKISDLTILESNNNIPNLFNGSYRWINSIEHNGELVGIFWVQITAEPTLIFVEGIGKLSKARAIDEIFKFLHCQISNTIAICDSIITLNEKEFDPYYVEYLKKHYNYQEIKQALRIRRKNG